MSGVPTGGVLPALLDDIQSEGHAGVAARHVHGGTVLADDLVDHVVVHSDTSRGGQALLVGAHHGAGDGLDVHADLGGTVGVLRHGLIAGEGHGRSFRDRGTEQEGLAGHRVLNCQTNG